VKEVAIVSAIANEQKGHCVTYNVLYKQRPALSVINLSPATVEETEKNRLELNFDFCARYL